jgi:hypothetical protein
MMRKPYKLSSRDPLDAPPPFNPQLVREMLAAAAIGPKGRVVETELSDREVAKLVGTLNQRRALFISAQEARAVAARRDRAMRLIAELRDVLPEIINGRQRTGDFFERNATRALQALCDAIASDLPERSLPPVTLSENIPGWKWCGKSLHEDAAPLIGCNAAFRFLALAIPLVSGEHPKAAAIATWIKQQRKAA